MKIYSVKKKKTHFTPPYEKYIERFKKSDIHFLYHKPATDFQYMNFIPQVNNKFSLFTKFDMGVGRKKPRKGDCAMCCMLVTQSCPALCHLMVCNPPGFSVLRISRQEYWSG